MFHRGFRQKSMTGSIHRIDQCCRSCPTTKGLDLLLLPQFSINKPNSILFPARIFMDFGSGRIPGASFWSWATGTSIRCASQQSSQTAPWHKARSKRFKLGGIPRHPAWPNICPPKAGWGKMGMADGVADWMADVRTFFWPWHMERSSWNYSQVSSFSGVFQGFFL